MKPNYVAATTGCRSKPWREGLSRGPRTHAHCGARFTAIYADGTDSNAVIAGKLRDIELRSAAVDALGAIGEAVAPSTSAVIKWALTIRLVFPEKATRNQDEQFIDLVILDAEYRRRVVTAITNFSQPAFSILVQLLKSSEAEVRKFVVTIIGLAASTSRET
jgi:hypothetical protein